MSSGISGGGGGGGGGGSSIVLVVMVVLVLVLHCKQISLKLLNKIKETNCLNFFK